VQVGRQLDTSVGWLVGWLAGWLAGWGWLVGWFNSEVLSVKLRLSAFSGQKQLLLADGIQN